MTTPLLATKLCAPPAQPHLISRPRLMALLSEGLSRPLTLLSAPPGFGKTSLLSEWLMQQQTPAAWITLDEGDNDPARFLSYLIAAFQAVHAHVGEACRQYLELPQPPPTEVILTTLVNELAAAPGHTLLVLDDYHLISAQPVHDALVFLISHQPPHLHVIIASRADPPLPLALWRARSQLAELRTVDLRFSAGEAAEFLNHAMGLELSAEHVAALVARTEGWITGLQLAAISMRSHTDAAGFIRAFTGTNRFVLDFLIEEVLGRQPEHIQSFLVQTSILNRLSAPLCDAVTGRDGGQATLEALEHANLFIVPLDDERKWYRYHRLFADLLQKRLGESHPDLVPALHRRASAWHEQNGLMDEAIDHALAAKDFERAAQLVEWFAEATLMRSESATLLKWINALPEPHVRARPVLCVYHAWVLLLGGSSLEAVEARLQPLEGHAIPLVLPLRALVANYRGDVARAIELSQRALEQLPESEALMRGLAMLNLAAAYHTQGDLAASQRVLQDAALGSHQTGNVMFTVAALCHRADLGRREGKLRQARSLYQQAFDFATHESGDRLPIAGRALIGLGEIAREWNELDAATQYILEGIELAGRWAEAATLEAYYVLARIRQAQGDWGGVHEALQAMRRVAVEFKATEVDDRLVDMVEAWMQIVQGDPSAALRHAQDGSSGQALDGPRQWAEKYCLSGNVDPLRLQETDDITFRRLRKYEYPVAARLWMAEGRPAQAIALLESALPIAEQANRVGLMIEYEILIALAAQALGQSEKAMQALERALALAEPDGYVRLFVDEGKPMARLLYEAAAGRIQPDYVGRLLAAFPTSKPSPPKQSEMIEPLSEREVEVLQLIAEGLSNEGIAQRLVLSLPTVKWHTSNIYGKLGVKSRTEAVARAKTLSILRAPLA